MSGGIFHAGYATSGDGIHWAKYRGNLRFETIIDNSALGAPADELDREEKLPPLELLDEGSLIAMSPDEIDAKKQIIEQTLADFGLPATVTEIRRGPAVTQFGVQPGYIERTGPDGEMKRADRL